MPCAVVKINGMVSIYGQMTGQTTYYESTFISLWPQKSLISTVGHNNEFLSFDPL